MEVQFLLVPCLLNLILFFLYKNFIKNLEYFNINFSIDNKLFNVNKNIFSKRDKIRILFFIIKCIHSINILNQFQ